MLSSSARSVSEQHINLQQRHVEQISKRRIRAGFAHHLDEALLAGLLAGFVTPMATAAYASLDAGLI